MMSASKRDKRLQPREELTAGSSDQNSDRAALPGGGQPSSNAASATEDWRELAHRIQNETDPAVMLELVQQLVARLDAKNPLETGRKQK
jgi:hypothetical protein